MRHAITLFAEAYAPKERAKPRELNDLIIFAVRGVSPSAFGALIDAAGWGRMNAVALPFVAVARLAAACFAMLRPRPATPEAPRPQRGW